MTRSMTRGFGISAAVHLGLLACLYLAFARPSQPLNLELDFSQAPRLPLPAGRPPVHHAAKSWVAPKQGLAPVPSTLTESAQEEPIVPTCPPPCPERPGDFVPAGLAARQPRWVAGFISDEDYPKIAAKNGQDGRVVLSVFIDAQGKVLEVQLLKGAYDALNQLAIEKVKAARFEPAYDSNGKPVPCRLTLPIKFELAD